MYFLNSNEKQYTIKELKQDWLFKLLCKFLKQHDLFNAVTKDSRKFYTMHSCNYCITKMFFYTMSVTLPCYVRNRYTLDILWSDFIGEHLDIIPEDIKGLIIFDGRYSSIRMFFEEKYYETYHRKYLGNLEQ